MKLLLTGFEPFGKSKVNPTEEVVKRIAKTDLNGIDLTTEILGVACERGPKKLLQLLSKTKPDAVLCLGEGSTYSCPYLERVFINRLEFQGPDNDGNIDKNEPINPEGPNAYFATLPVEEIYKNLKEVGIPSLISDTAGAYICNQVGYMLMDYLHRENRNIPAGLIHLPWLPVQAARQGSWVLKNSGSMSLDTTVPAIKIAIETIAKRTVIVV